MGLCFSCCSSSDGSEERQRRRTLLAEQERNIQMNDLVLDECSFPAKFSLGQSYVDPKVGGSSSPRNDTIGSTSFSAVTSNRPAMLQKIAVSWHSPVSVTRKELERKRVEFWETAPAYGGQPVVWQAIQEAIEVGNFDMETARTILSCAGVITPTGRLTEAYDDHGFRYVIPNYCLCDPANGFAQEEESTIEDDPTLLDYGDNSVFSGLKAYDLKIKVSNGDDLSIGIPSSPDVCIGHLKSMVSQELSNTGKIEFFWAGHGPLANSVKLSSIEGLYDQNRGRLQAWIFHM